MHALGTFKSSTKQLDRLNMSKQGNLDMHFVPDKTIKLDQIGIPRDVMLPLWSLARRLHGSKGFLVERDEATFDSVTCTRAICRNHSVANRNMFGLSDFFQDDTLNGFQTFALDYLLQGVKSCTAGSIVQTILRNLQICPNICSKYFKIAK